MKNKVFLKRYLIITLIICIVILTSSIVLSIREYNEYTINYSNKIEKLASLILEEYPDVDESELLSILNNKDSSKVLESYGIFDKDNLLLENNKAFYKYLVISLIVISIGIITLLSIYLLYDYRKDKEIKKITKYIEEINNKNYSLYIDDYNEDELSILKSEIYKTTIMLKSIADISVKDKISIKRSLEDISHQLKTPITSILIILDNLIDDRNMNKDVQEEFIKDIKREVTSINNLIQNILKLSKFDVNTITMTKDKVSVNDIINKVKENLATLCDLKNITINVNESEASLSCDFMWQVEALTNIVKNSIEHSRSGSSIDIVIDSNNVYCSIKIRDYGKGISEYDINHIFERFYRSKNSSKTSNGIGLSLAKSIIEKDNGVVSVESCSKGTVFTIKYFD